uniref:Uncharacterized protein n=1 Tax=Plectus sambesii TaxID=2011161 RepID=A0A914WSD9_9BILA
MIYPTRSVGPPLHSAPKKRPPFIFISSNASLPSVRAPNRINHERRCEMRSHSTRMVCWGLFTLPHRHLSSTTAVGSVGGGSGGDEVTICQRRSDVDARQQTTSCIIQVGRKTSNKMKATLFRLQNSRYSRGTASTTCNNSAAGERTINSTVLERIPIAEKRTAFVSPLLRAVQFNKTRAQHEMQPIKIHRPAALVCEGSAQGLMFIVN